MEDPPYAVGTSERERGWEGERGGRVREDEVKTYM